MLPVADEIGAGYQHAYQVRRAARLLPMARAAPQTADRTSMDRPILMVQTLLDHGFVPEARWSLAGFGVLPLDLRPPQGAGVYAFALDGVVHYVGVATRCVAHRLGCYRRPNITHAPMSASGRCCSRRSQRGKRSTFWSPRPGMAEWNGLPVNNSAWLELGLIQATGSHGTSAAERAGRTAGRKPGRPGSMARRRIVGCALLPVRAFPAAAFHHIRHASVRPPVAGMTHNPAAHLPLAAFPPQRKFIEPAAAGARTQASMRVRAARRAIELNPMARGAG
jgi:hypothetical protein